MTLNRFSVGEPARLRDVAARLRELLAEVREARRDCRSFVLFERRDALAALGIDHNVIDTFDAEDDAALDRHIANCTACLRGVTPLDEDGDDDVSVTAQAGSASPFGDGYETLYAKGYSPDKCRPVNARVTPDMIASVEANRNLVDPGWSQDEQMAFGAADGHGGFSFVKPRVKRQRTLDGYRASAPAPPNSALTLHGHPRTANGFVDDPQKQDDYLGDAHPIAHGGMPNFTLFDGEIAWHDMENDQLRFTYPAGSMSRTQKLQKQRNLDGAQKWFCK